MEKVIGHLFKNYFSQGLNFQITCTFENDRIGYEVADSKILKEIVDIMATMIILDSVKEQDPDRYNDEGKRGLEQIDQSVGTYRNILFEQLLERLEGSNWIGSLYCPLLGWRRMREPLSSAIYGDQNEVDWARLFS